MRYATGPAGSHAGSYDGLRISVGTDSEIDTLLAALRDIL